MILKEFVMLPMESGMQFSIDLVELNTLREPLLTLLTHMGMYQPALFASISLRLMRR
jgi:hypothetical protein